MYLKIEEDLYKKIQSITMTDYNQEGGMIPAENIETMLEDLLCEISGLEEKIQDMQQDIEENYEIKKFDPYKEYGLNESDFF